MQRRFLEAQLEAGRSLEQIGAMVGKHPSTVSYWLKKYGLVAAHHDQFAPKRCVEAAELAELVDRGLTRAEIARTLGISGSTLSYWLRKLGLHTKRGVRLAQLQAARDAGLRLVQGRCPKHGATNFRLTRRGTYRCTRCASDAVSARRRRVKRILVDEAGGRCLRCGFSDHPAALEFHHTDPSTKEFNLSQHGVTRSLDKARAEARKCVLLCSNCHALVEAGVATV
jgi:transposase-like protein